jgi:hypothetical protein
MILMRFTSREFPPYYDYTHDQSDGSLVDRDAETEEE